MAIGRITQTFPDGTIVEVLLDSDLDSLADVGAAVIALWRDTVTEDES